MATDLVLSEFVEAADGDTGVNFHDHIDPVLGAETFHQPQEFEVCTGVTARCEIQVMIQPEPSTLPLTAGNRQSVNDSEAGCMDNSSISYGRTEPVLPTDLPNQNTIIPKKQNAVEMGDDVSITWLRFLC